MARFCVRPTRALVEVLGLLFYWILSSSAQEWKLVYEEDFSSITSLPTASWFLDDYRESFDTIMDDPGLWYSNDYGPAFSEALNSFNTYRKEYTFGTDGWLTASFSARDWDKNGSIENEPILKLDTINDKKVLTMQVDDHTGGVILRPTSAMPAEYRIEYKLTMLDFGGKRGGTIEYDNRINGYSSQGCKTQHPWGEGSTSPGWAGDASASYCDWQDVRRGRYGYNGFHFLSIVDFADPAPRNNHFWHYRRKVLMDSFSQHPDRVGEGTGGQVCNANTLATYAYRDSSFNTINMWVSGLPNSWTPNPGQLAGNKQLFMTTCNGGTASRGVQSAAELQPDILMNEPYTFAIERNSTGYTLEASGNFARVGYKTLRFYRPFVVDDEPIWHYNVNVQEYNGRFNNHLKQEQWDFGSMEWKNQWPLGSSYPDYFVIGDLYTNVYEGRASLTDIKFFEADGNDATNESNRCCDYTVFLEPEDFYTVGYHVIPHKSLFFVQQVNGNFELHRGTPRDPVSLVWESGVDESTDGSYFTTLQWDGSLVTSRVDEQENTRAVWTSGTSWPDAHYFFTLEECHGLDSRLSIFRGHPERGGSFVWNMHNSLLDIPCINQVLLEMDDVLRSGAFRQAGNFFIAQLSNGNLQIRTGSPESPGPTVWETGIDRGLNSESVSYYSHLQSDGNLITWAQPSNGGSRFVVWKTNTVYPPGEFTLLLECIAKGGSVAIYQGQPGGGGVEVWREAPFFLPTIAGLGQTTYDLTEPSTCAPASASSISTAPMGAPPVSPVTPTPVSSPFSESVQPSSLPPSASGTPKPSATAASRPPIEGNTLAPAQTNQAQSQSSVEPTSLRCWVSALATVCLVLLTM